MLSRSAKRTRLIAIAKVMPAAPMRRRRLFFLAKIYPFSPSCLTSPSTRMPTLPVAECLARGFAMSSSLLLLTQDCVSPDQSEPRVEIVLRGLLNETLHHPTDRLRSPLEAAPQRRSLRGRTARPLRPAAALRQQQAKCGCTASVYGASDGESARSASQSCLALSVLPSCSTANAWKPYLSLGSAA